MAAPPAQQQQQQQLRSSSKTVTDTLVGQHEHHIVGYSLIKGLGDGEPTASERFTVGGHEWVLLLYPDGKRSSSAEGHGGGGGGGGGDHANLLMPPPAHQLPAPAALGAAAAAAAAGGAGGGGAAAAAAENEAVVAAAGAMANAAGALAAVAAQNLANAAAAAAAVGAAGQALRLPNNNQLQGNNNNNNNNNNNRRDTTNEYAALFVALIGEGANPQGVVNTSEGKVVRAFHRFTLVDQSGQGRDLTKGRTRDAGAVKISCARLDPNARNCHGYRKFVKRSILEDPTKGYLLNDTIIIRYTIELVVSSGGALSRSAGARGAGAEPLVVPPSSLAHDMAQMRAGGKGTDFQFLVDGQVFHAHRMVLQARSPYMARLTSDEMREGQEGKSVVDDVKAPVFDALLHFVYADQLPEELEGGNLDVPMAQHLLAAADKYQLKRLRTICERRLCEAVDVETVGTTLALAEQNHAEELKKVCLDFVSRHLQAVMATEGYRHMVRSCPDLQAELLTVLAQAGPALLATGAGGGAAGGGGGAAHRAEAGRALRLRDVHAAAAGEGAGAAEDAGRRVRPRRE